MISIDIPAPFQKFDLFVPRRVYDLLEPTLNQIKKKSTFWDFTSKSPASLNFGWRYPIPGFVGWEGLLRYPMPNSGASGGLSESEKSKSMGKMCLAESLHSTTSTPFSFRGPPDDN